jgi:pimeloyl-ACP methyl ester carboxylesterase
VGDGRGEADVIASSLSSAFVIALARRDPSLFRRLVLVCPTGMEELVKKPGTKGAMVKSVLKAPVLGQSVYNMIVSREGIRSYLKRNVYASPDFVTDELVDQFYTSAHQPGGDRVLPSFISGHLNCDITQDFPGVIDLPLIVWGREAGETPLSQAEAFLTANPNAKLEVIEDAGMLPHEEQPQAFLVAVRPFLSKAETEEEYEQRMGNFDAVTTTPV